MKQVLKLTSLALLLLAFVMSAVACGNGQTTTVAGGSEQNSLWANATYTEDTALGEGANTFTMKIEAEGKAITLTIHTDALTVGEALYALGLINDPSFFDTCNGIVADWSKDQAYWGFYEGGKLLSYGVDDSKATTVGNPNYEMIYTKW